MLSRLCLPLQTKVRDDDFLGVSSVFDFVLRRSVEIRLSLDLRGRVVNGYVASVNLCERLRLRFSAGKGATVIFERIVPS